MHPELLALGALIGCGTTVVGAAIWHRRAKRYWAGELSRADEQRAAVDRERLRMERELIESAGEFGAEIARLETALAAERRLADEKLSALTEARDDLIAVVKKSAGQAISARGADLLQTLKLELRAVQLKGDAVLERREKAVDELVAPVRQTLEQMTETLQRVDHERRRAHAELSERLKHVVVGQRELREETETLARVLQGPNTRGRWGEMHLRRLVEVAGMSSLCDFSEQRAIDGADNVLRPDLIVHLPGDRHVIVDSKAPIDLFGDTGDAARTAPKALRAHVRALAAKNYSANVSRSVDFVVLYLPGKHLFSTVVAADETLIEDAAKQSVLIASPTTLLVLLKTIAYSWQGERVAKEAHAIAALSRRLHEQLRDHLNHLGGVSRRLNGLVAAHNGALDALQTVTATSEQIGVLGAAGETPALPTVRKVEKTAATPAPEFRAG